jgi:hypothetical protein
MRGGSDGVVLGRDHAVEHEGDLVAIERCRRVRAVER